MNRRPRRAGVVLGGTVAIILLGSTSAVAYWTTMGSGSGTAEAGSFVAPVVSAGTVTGPALYPGLTANGTSAGGTLAMVASNPNPFPVTVNVSQSGPATGCTTPAVTLTSGSFSLPANANSVTTTLPFSVSMGPTSSNDCQGKTLTIPLTTSSTSN
jgi:hypothetical protein